jgi:hypothetical protein
VPEPGALLLLAIHPPQHRVHVHKHQPCGARQQRGALGQPNQERSRGGLQLPYVTVGELALSGISMVVKN